MNITLTKIKFAEFASEETNCFEAVLCLDGKPIAHVSNDGKGGADRVYPIGGNEALKSVEDYVKTRTYTIMGRTRPHNLGTFVGDLFDEWLAAKDLAKHLKKFWVFQDGEKLKEVSRKKYPNLTAEMFAEKKINVVLNFLPFDQALKIFLKQ